MSDQDGLLCIGGNLGPETLVDSYYHGIFPWPQEGLPILWFCPSLRGIIEFSGIHIPQRLRRFRKSWKGEFRINTAFNEVIKACRHQKRPGQRGTWILPSMVKAYTNLHLSGYAHSVEAWEDGELTGGIYGVFVGNVFSGESMFYRKPNRSKLCLWYLIERLSAIGLTWIDVQMLTELTKSFGGVYIPREDFLKRVEEAHNKKPTVFV
ncbi:MAG: leucyl/phenylalanyl-tRNA--protein transferase [Spirochaetota bacterium]